MVDNDERRAPVEVVRTPVVVGPVGSRLQRLDCSSGVEGVIVTGLGSAGAGGSGSGGDVAESRTEVTPRDPTSGKDPIVEEEGAY